METYYSDERNVQILISLMKAHGIKKVVASPGATNVSLVSSLQIDPYFEIYSSVDERSAAYIACGMAAESGEPVALTCTGATASRNYIPGLTEAFYRKLPVLAITSTQHTGKVGSNEPQVLDRSNPLNDIAKLSVNIPNIHTSEDEWAYTLMLNKAILELTHRGGGPVHVNLTTNYSPNFNVKTLPKVKVVRRICANNDFPALPEGNIGIFVGAHAEWSDELTAAVDSFCEKINAVVFCDHTSNYTGKYRVFPHIVANQDTYESELTKLALLIDIGNISGAYLRLQAKELWRVNPDGELRDYRMCLTKVFEMEESEFFSRYAQITPQKNESNSFLAAWQTENEKFLKKLPELPFSNIWVAQHTASKLPENCRLHLGILNSLRSWNFFETSPTIPGYSNTGGFGIDGNMSSMLGASLASPDKLFFGVFGDLSFFYDMNSIGNRHINNNMRIMLINNGIGTEFKNYNHRAAKFGDKTDEFMAASGHFGQQSRDLVRHYAEDLGFEYLCADNKEDYLKYTDHFVSPEIFDKPILFEVFTNNQDESNALHTVHNLEYSAKKSVKKKIKDFARKTLGAKNIMRLKKIIK